MDTVAFADKTSTPGWNLCRQRSWLACRSGRDNHSNLRRRRNGHCKSTFPQVETTRFTATSFIDNRTGWAVGSGGSVYRTMNGGRASQRQESKVDVDLFDVKFVDALEGLGRQCRTIIHTTDGGRRTLNAATSSRTRLLQRPAITVGPSALAAQSCRTCAAAPAFDTPRPR